MEGRDLAELEVARLAMQDRLDARKGRLERNQGGQFATPPKTSADMLRHAKALLGDVAGVRFLDPAIGTGSFYSALLDAFPRDRIHAAVGYEIDGHYGEPAAGLWKGTGLDMRREDFTRARPPGDPGRFNLLICNPPYVRHHHIGSREKRRLKAGAYEACGMNISGLAGLHCYFIGLCHAWMADGGLAGWLVPSEIMDVNYGSAVKRYLLNRVTLLHIHRFDTNDLQFGDTMVSSAIVWFRREEPLAGHMVRFTYGGSLGRPELERHVHIDTLRRDPKWTRYPLEREPRENHGPVLGDFFTIRRGLATGGNEYFILAAKEIWRRGLPMEMFRPILPNPRYLPDDEVAADAAGNPLLDRRTFLLDCKMAEGEVRRAYPNLWAYLQEGRTRGMAENYICGHRPLWYRQENRPPPPFLCTCLGRGDKKRGRPFRFILNHSQATAANVYLLLYPKRLLGDAIGSNQDVKRQVWELLNGIDDGIMLGNSRAYGNGLYKMEPKNLESVPATAISDMLGAPVQQHLETAHG